MKRCTKCKEDRLEVEFSKHKSRKSGLNSWCKFCTRAYAKSLGICSVVGCKTTARTPKGGGLCLRHKSQFDKGEDYILYPQGPQWNLNGQGYVTRWVRDSETGKRYAEQQHRFVMERAIGRKLLPGENVHHRNGIRSDNRIENLELWAVSQHSGQRVSDLLAWADEVLKRYEPLEAKGLI